VGSAVIVAMASAVAVVAAFVGAYILVEHPTDLNARLQAYAGLAQRRAHSAPGKERLLGRLLAPLDHLLGGQIPAQRLALHLAQANVRLTVPEFLAIACSAALVGGSVGFALHTHLLSGLAGTALGLAAPWILLERKRQKRIRAFHDQLLDVLVLIVGSLRSGHGLLNALELANRELSPPACEEFARVLREIGFGIGQTEALNNLVRRMETDDLQLMVTAINISHEVGGSLSLVLEKIAETIRERVRLQGEIRVLTTQQRLTSYLLVALPVLLGAVLSLMNPRYMMGLFRPPWLVIPAAALALELVGFFIAQRLTRIEV